MTQTLLGFFATGSSYYPPHHAEGDWERDVRRMAEAGLKVIRTAELLATWDRIEMRRGQPDWSWLDRIFELAGQYGLKIILGTGSCNPPIWLTEMYQDLQIVSRDSVPYPTATMWGWACKEHAGYRAEVERYLTLLLERYGQHPALLAWQIDNEPGFPLVPRNNQPTIDHYCYCEQHARGFRKWLRAKYGNISALNQAWAWDPTHHQYYDWHLVSPPRSMPTEWGGVTHWLDWRTYQYDALAEFLRWQNNLIKARDNKHPTYTNIFCWSGQEMLMGMDGWRLARVGDAIGYDIYPTINRRCFTQPEYVSMYLDTAASQARQAGVEFWLPEIESGPLLGWALGPDHNTNGLDVKRFNLEFIAHGAKLILYQGYREWNCIPLHWGALVDFHGVPTQRYHAAAEVNRVIADNESLILNARPLAARIAILDDPANHTVLVGMGAYDHMVLCVRGCYQAFWSQGYRVDFVSPAGLAADIPYDVICLPFAMLITADTGQRLREFVERGRTLIAFAKCAMLDDKGWSWNDRPGAGLAEVFGVMETSIERQDRIELRMNTGETLPGYWHKQNLVVSHGAEVLATFADGSPAMVSCQFGRGRAIYIATHLDAATVVLPKRAGAVRSVFRQFMNTAGIKPIVELAGGDPDALALGVAPHLLVSGDSHMFVAVNNSPNEISFAARLPGLTAQRTVRDLFSGHIMTAHADSGALTFDLTLRAWDGTMLELHE
ncbi:MAG: beta-galactosidase [Chloroflexi bacterium]|nr:beta-galactosidase [Chloroflexota bacterium]